MEVNAVERIGVTSLVASQNDFLTGGTGSDRKAY